MAGADDSVVALAALQVDSCSGQPLPSHSASASVDVDSHGVASFQVRGQESSSRTAAGIQDDRSGPGEVSNQLTSFLWLLLPLVDRLSVWPVMKSRIQ